jgi:hypothetical protein
VDFSRFFGFLVLILLMWVFAASLSWADKCETIRFKRGESSGSVKGIASPETSKCYQMTTGQGQTAALRVSGNNMAFSIDGIIDAQESYRFTTAKKTYKIYVFQLFRSVTDRAFTLFVSVE